MGAASTKLFRTVSRPALWTKFSTSLDESKVPTLRTSLWMRKAVSRGAGAPLGKPLTSMYWKPLWVNDAAQVAGPEPLLMKVSSCGRLPTTTARPLLSDSAYRILTAVPAGTSSVMRALPEMFCRTL